MAQLHETPSALPPGSGQPPQPRRLATLPDGARAVVVGLTPATADVDPAALRRLGEIGFLPGEPVQVVRRGPGGREPLAVVVGQTMFGLRLLEAASIEVLPDDTGARAA